VPDGDRRDERVFVVVERRVTKLGEVSMIDPEIIRSGLDLSRRMGQGCREILLESGMTKQEVDDVIKEAFAWLHKEDA